MTFLKNHPFAVEAHFESSLVLTFAVPKEELKSMIPDCLELDTYDEKWAFIAVAMVQTKDLRPKGFPRILGNDFFLIGYRIFVKYTNKAGKRLRGLFILKSETNKRMMQFFGNTFTHYDYTTTDITRVMDENWRVIKSNQSNFNIEVEQTSKQVELPKASPFKDWKTARRFAGPLPFTFTYNKVKQSVLIIKGVRQNWKPEPVNVISYNFKFLKDLNVSGAILANAFEVKDIPYCWEKGKLETWTK